MVSSILALLRCPYPNPHEYTSAGSKRGFADMIKLRVLIGESGLDFPGGLSVTIKVLYKRELVAKAEKEM